MPTLLSNVSNFFKSFAAATPAPQVAPAELTGQLLYANPRVQTSSGFRYNANLLVQRKTMRVYDEMRRDEQIKAALNLKKQFVIASGWEVVSPEGQDDDWEVTQFVSDCFEDMGEEFDRALLQILSALDFGFSVTEKIYAYRNADRDEWNGKLCLDCLKTVAPHDIQFYTDPFGNLMPDGIRQMGNVQPKPFPTDKFVVFPWQMEFGNWYGDSDLNACHRAWLLKDQAYQWLGIGLERFGVPPTYMSYDPSAVPSEVVTALKGALTNIQAASVMLFPRGKSKDSLTMEWPEQAGQVPTVFIPTLDMLDKAMAKALLMPGLLGLSPDNKYGSRSNGSTHFDVFLLVIEHARELLASGVINDQLVRELVDLNYAGVDKYPIFRFKPLGDDVKADRLTLWGILTDQGVVQSTPADEEYTRERLEFPTREEAQDSLPKGPDGKPLPPPGSAAPQLGPDGKPLPTQAGPDGKPVAAPLPPDDNPPSPAKDNKRKRPARTYALPADAIRKITPYERKVDFVAIEKDLDNGAADYLPRLKSALGESRDALITQVRQNFNGDLGWANALKGLPALDDFHSTMAAMLKDIHAAGRNSIKREMPQAYKSLPAANLTDAMNYLNTKAIQVSGVTEQKILDATKAALLQAVSTGEPLDDTVNRLRDIYAPYTDETVDDNGDLNDPYRLETIVRTNLTDVYNMGRMLQANQAGDYLEAWQYSAIIDGRTTECCRLLDGTIVMADDDRANQIRPPRHYNCRSVMVPVTTGETVDSTDLLSDDDFSEAMSLSGF